MTAWRKLEPGDGPDAREDHTWTLDPSTRTAYLFGGRDGSTVYDDIWAFDLASDTWREIDPGGRGPAARFGHEAVWVDGVGLVVWAGQAGPTAFFDDLWAYDPAANDWSRLPNDGREARCPLWLVLLGWRGRSPLDQPRLHRGRRPVLGHARLRLRCRPLDGRNP